MSKGSKPRPIDKDQYDSNFDRIFGQKPLTAIKPVEEEYDWDTINPTYNLNSSGIACDPPGTINGQFIVEPINTNPKEEQ